MKEQASKSSTDNQKSQHQEQSTEYNPFFDTLSSSMSEGIAQRKENPFFDKSASNPFLDKPASNPFFDKPTNNPFSVQAMNSPSSTPTVQKREIKGEQVQMKQATIQKKKNNTGLPDNLKSGIENLSGYSMDDVKVHRNSSKPAQLQAHAYAQGTDIHLGAGQETHLAHEAWHVVQQKQGRVKPTMQMKGKVNINDDTGLEREADVMGAKALQMGSSSRATENQNTSTQMKAIVQREENADEEKEKEEVEEAGGAIQAKLKNATVTNQVAQRAYTARRPLGGWLSFGLSSRLFKNKGVFHEHIFFEDQDQDENYPYYDIGFHDGDNKLFQDTPDMILKYEKVLTGLDDRFMRTAVDNVGDPGKYALLGNNCQAYVEKVVNEYHELKSMSETLNVELN